MGTRLSTRSLPGSRLPLSTAALSWFLRQVRGESLTGERSRRGPDPCLQNLPPIPSSRRRPFPLQRDGQAYAARLQADGKRSNLPSVPGTTHEFFGMGAVVAKAQAAEQYAAAQVAASFR